MCLRINSRAVEGVILLDLTGKITIGENSIALRNSIRRNIGEGNIKLILNLASVDYMDPSGIGEFVSSYCAVNKSGGTLKLLSVPYNIFDLFCLTRLNTLFDFFDDEAEAINSF